MPVAKGPKIDARSAVIVGVIAVVAALVIGVAAIVLAQRSDRLILGDLDFRTLNTDRIAETIAGDGPILFPDVGGGTRDIWLQHLGEDPAVGWSAFDARPPGTGRECNATWEPAAMMFADPCSNETVYPADGAGLPQIPVYLDGTQLVIDMSGIRSADDFAGYSPS